MVIPLIGYGLVAVGTAGAGYFISRSGGSSNENKNEQKASSTTQTPVYNRFVTNSRTTTNNVTEFNTSNFLEDISSSGSVGTSGAYKPDAKNENKTSQKTNPSTSTTQTPSVTNDLSNTPTQSGNEQDNTFLYALMGVGAVGTYLYFNSDKKEENK